MDKDQLFTFVMIIVGMMLSSIIGYGLALESKGSSLIEEVFPSNVTISQGNQTINIDGFNITYMSQDKINDLWKQNNVTKYGDAKVEAFFDPRDRMIYIPLTDNKDIKNESMPDLCLLGHEVYHLPELGGAWHD